MTDKDNGNGKNELTKDQAAKLVKRDVIVKDKDGKVATDKDGQVVTKSVAIKADEVLNFKDYGDYVVVVTNDGQKFRGAKA